MSPVQIQVIEAARRPRPIEPRPSAFSLNPWVVISLRWLGRCLLN